MEPLLGLFNEWIGLTDLASKHGAKVDHMLEVVHWFMIALTVGWTAFFFYVIVRFHKSRNPKASYAGVTSHFTTHIEALVVIIEVVLLVGFAFPLWSQRVDENRSPDPNDPEVLRIRAVGEAFFWNFHYAGEDTQFGLIRADRIGSNNPVGIVSEDPNSQDDFISPGELLIPKGKTVVIQVTSKDVIHNLALIPMRTQQDAIPGMELPMWFVPTKTGEWDIVCAQLCGAGHATMRAQLRVVEQEEFDEWFAGKTAMAKSQNAPVAAASTEPAAQ